MITAQTVRRLAARALANGGFHPSDNPTLVEWDVSARCQRQRTRVITARGEVDHMSRWVANAGIMTVILHTRCRQCEWCLKQRNSLWRFRAIAECEQASRTWFGTFTLTPEEHYRCWVRALHALRRQNGGELPSLTAIDEYQIRASEASKLLTNYFKRLRKNTGLPIRYMLVAESHKSGYPHFHALIHEVGSNVTKKMLQATWPHGFTTMKLVENRRSAAAYVAKYISKSSMVRVRASQGYGKSRPRT